ncbi:MAG: hypothetical protein WA076_01120 [Lactococcus raffinolactis]
MRLNWRKYLVGRIVIVLGLSILFVLFINNNNHKEINRKTKTSVVDSKSKSVENSQSEKRSSSSEGDRKSHQVTTAAEEKNIIELKKGIIEQGMYIRLNGKLELATESNLKDIEKKIKNPVIYDMDKDGEMIMVIADSEER